MKARYPIMKLSLCMIVKDEEEVLSRCLSSVKDLFDEIVIADTGSSDGTCGIARSFGAELYYFPWNDDFSAARNFSFSKATGDYLFWLDADDVLPPLSRSKFAALRTLLERDRPDTVFLPYDTALDENGTPRMTFRRERVLKRSPLARWVGRVHECIVPFGRQCSFTSASCILAAAKSVRTAICASTGSGRGKRRSRRATCSITGGNLLSSPVSRSDRPSQRGDLGGRLVCQQDRGLQSARTLP